jgi:CIC family chloride channel protein
MEKVMTAHKTPSPHETAALEAKSELHEYLHVRDERKRLMPRALLVGLAAGLAAVAFRFSLDRADILRDRIVAYAHQAQGAAYLIPILYCAGTAALGLFIVRRFAPEAAGSGIPHLEGVLRRHRVLRWAIVLPTKFLGGLSAIASGMALGREGPTVQMGGAIGMGLAKALDATRRETLTLTAAGAGAGLAAAFNAPLSGLVFVLEELQRDFRPTVFGAAFIAAATADVVTRVVAGQGPIFDVPNYPSTSLATIPAFLILGAAAGLVGVAFNKGLIGALNFFSRMRDSRVYWATGIVGACIGVVAIWNPDSVGSGRELVSAALADHNHLGSTSGMLVLRFLLTVVSYGTGVAGGIFSPLLTIGAILGRGVGDLTAVLVPGLVSHPGVFGVVGMGALFTGIVRAPLTGIVLIVEMTSSYSQMLPLLIACFAAYATAEALRDLPIYEALLERDLLRGGTPVGEEEPIVLELEIQPGAPFDGKDVRVLGLPPGVVLVQCQDDNREFVPNASTHLVAFMRLTAIVSPESEGGAAALREGCGEM